MATSLFSGCVLFEINARDSFNPRVPPSTPSGYVELARSSSNVDVLRISTAKHLSFCCFRFLLAGANFVRRARMDTFAALRTFCSECLSGWPAIVYAELFTNKLMRVSRAIGSVFLANSVGSESLGAGQRWSSKWSSACNWSEFYYYAGLM